MSLEVLFQLPGQKLESEAYRQEGAVPENTPERTLIQLRDPCKTPYHDRRFGL